MWKRRRKTAKKVDPAKVQIESSSKGSPWLWRAIYADPASAASEFLENFDRWRSTRQWRRILWFAPALIIFIVCLGNVLWGATRSKAELRDRYLKLAEEESPVVVNEEGKQDPAAAGSTGDSGQSENAKEGQVKGSDYADLLYRRVLQLESNNTRARYYIAYRMAAAGNILQARARMQELAPEKGKGFEPAHAWLAADLVQQFTRGELRVDQQPALIHHLEIASTWNEVDPRLLIFYAGILENQNKIDEAIKICRRAAQLNSAFRLALAELLMRAKYTVPAQDEAFAAIKAMRENFGTKAETDQDRIGVARAHLIRNEINEAMAVLNAGLQINPERPALRRMLSEILRLQYRQSFRQAGSGVELNMNLLEAAASIDPTNPAVGEEIAQLSQIGYRATPETIETLRKQLANGTASAITHTLLGNAYAARDQWQKAISHWELALAQNPNLVVVLNNLAVALCKEDPSQVDRALGMIDRALSIVGGRDAELFDSRGLILTYTKRPIEAISWFEKSIAIDPNRVNTRQALIDAAKDANMTEMVELHTVALEELKARLEEQAAKEAAAAKAIQEANAAEPSGAADTPADSDGVESTPTSDFPASQTDDQGKGNSDPPTGASDTDGGNK